MSTRWSQLFADNIVFKESGKGFRTLRTKYKPTELHYRINDTPSLVTLTEVVNANTEGTSGITRIEMTSTSIIYGSKTVYENGKWKLDQDKYLYLSENTYISGDFYNWLKSNAKVCLLPPKATFASGVMYLTDQSGKATSYDIYLYTTLVYKDFKGTEFDWHANGIDVASGLRAVAKADGYADSYFSNAL